jgi:hypothetical protein
MNEEKQKCAYCGLESMIDIRKGDCLEMWLNKRRKKI